MNEKFTLYNIICFGDKMVNLLEFSYLQRYKYADFSIIREREMYIVHKALQSRANYETCLQDGLSETLNAYLKLL